jgi:hypothetical protein
MSCVIHDYSMGLIAQYRLLQEDCKTKTLPKLDVEYYRDDGYHFIHVRFNNQVAQGLRFTQWLGSDYYELTLDRVSISTRNKNVLNLKIGLIHINEQQELAEIAITGHTSIAGRMTDQNIIKNAQAHFQAIATDLAQAYRENRIPTEAYGTHRLTIAQVTELVADPPEKMRNPVA